MSNINIKRAVENIRANTTVYTPVVEIIVNAIQEIGFERKMFTLKATSMDEKFLVRLFKFYFPRNQRSRISLVAHKREVPGSAMDKYIPEFVDAFYDKDGNGETDRNRHYIIKAYVFGPYLDRNVSRERMSTVGSGRRVN
jgi:hypothetical protein